MILSENERLELARAALDQAIKRHGLIVIGNDVVNRMQNEAAIVGALVEFIEAKERHHHGD